MDNTKIRLIMSFAAEDVEALYSQQKQDLELTYCKISSLLQNSGLNGGKEGKLLAHSGIQFSRSVVSDLTP